MRYELTPIPTRPWQLNGLSLRLIESHYENNYGGALRRLNALTEQLDTLDFDSTPPHVVNGLKREQMLALNSTLLHELYFASIGFGDGRPTEGLAQVLAQDFGSMKRSQRIRRDGEGPGRWLRLGPARLRPAGSAARQSIRERSRADDGGGHPDPRARHVRARLPYRLRGQRHRLHRRLPPQYRLGLDPDALRGRHPRRGSAAAGPEGVRGPAGGGGRGGQGRAGRGRASAGHRCAPEVLHVTPGGHHGRSGLA